MLDPRDLQNLVAVYEQRHFGNAARARGLSQPSITKSIQRLEKSIGLALFDRSRSGVEPTMVCDSIVARAKIALAELKDLDDTIRLLCGIEVGSLAVGVGPAMSESLVTEAIGSLAEEHPAVQVTVRVDHWEQLVEWLVTGEIELLVADLTDLSEDSRFSVTPLPPQEFVWFCHRKHPLARRKQVSRRELLRYPLATPRMPPWAVAWFREAIAQAGHDEKAIPLPTIRCESYSALKRIVLSSHCVSVALEETIRPEVESGSLVALTLDTNGLTTHAGIVQRRDRTLSPLAATFIDKVRKLFNAE